ncbi:hypothetical protein ABH935_009852 [Catenulispora sp. GAS73]
MARFGLEVIEGVGGQVRILVISGFAPGHSWDCHGRRFADRMVFGHMVAVLVHGSGYERIASVACD